MAQVPFKTLEARFGVHPHQIIFLRISPEFPKNSKSYYLLHHSNNLINSYVYVEYTLGTGGPVRIA